MSNTTTESRAKVAGLNRATAIACVAVAAVAAWMCWPSRNEIRLVSPDGRHTVVISATNDGAAISVNGHGSGTILISTVADNSPQIEMTALGAGTFIGPTITLNNTNAESGGGSRIVTAK